MATGTRQLLAVADEEVVEVLSMSKPMFDLTAGGGGRAVSPHDVLQHLSNCAWYNVCEGQLPLRKLATKCRVEEYRQVGAWGCGLFVVCGCQRVYGFMPVCCLWFVALSLWPCLCGFVALCLWVLCLRFVFGVCV